MTSQTNTGCCYSYDTFQGLVNRYFSKLTPNFERKTLSTSCTHFQKYKSRYFQKRNQSGHQVTIWAGESTGSNKLIQPLVLFSRHKGIALKGMIICSVASWKSKILNFFSELNFGINESLLRARLTHSSGNTSHIKQTNSQIRTFFTNINWFIANHAKCTGFQAENDFFLVKL